MAEEKEIPAGMKDEIAEFAPFYPSKNKKKKKVVIQDSAEEADKLAEKTENLSVADAPEPNFVGMKKKKKKPVETEVISDEQGMLEKSLMVIVMEKMRKERGLCLEVCDIRGKALIEIIYMKSFWIEYSIS